MQWLLALLDTGQHDPAKALLDSLQLPQRRHVLTR
jgi:hypothetical protein